MKLRVIFGLVARKNFLNLGLPTNIHRVHMSSLSNSKSPGAFCIMVNFFDVTIKYLWHQNFNCDAGSKWALRAGHVNRAFEFYLHFGHPALKNNCSIVLMEMFLQENLILINSCLW